MTAEVWQDATGVLVFLAPGYTVSTSRLKFVGLIPLALVDKDGFELGLTREYDLVKPEAEGTLD